MLTRAVLGDSSLSADDLLIGLVQAFQLLPGIIHADLRKHFRALRLSGRIDSLLGPGGLRQLDRQQSPEPGRVLSRPV